MLFWRMAGPHVAPCNGFLWDGQATGGASHMNARRLLKLPELLPARVPEPPELVRGAEAPGRRPCTSPCGTLYDG